MSEPAANSNELATFENVKNYYGKVLRNVDDLKTGTCVPNTRPLPRHIKDALEEVHEDIVARYYGCGLVVPQSQSLEGCHILDLGSGSGRDCFVLSKLVGEKGHVTGIDMTSEQIDTARKYIDHHIQKFGFKKANVEFIHGYIENLKEAGLKDNTYDIIISNCVINLSPDKKAVLKEAYRVLKDGGEMYFSDVYANLELPEEIRKHKLLWECLGGALFWKDLVNIAKEAGFTTPRLVTAKQVMVNNKELEAAIGDCKYVSATYRLFKIPKTCAKEKCQVIYNGSIKDYEKEMEFDSTYTFKEGDITDVDEELAAILKYSRFADDFMMRPQGGKQTGGCCPNQPKEILVDPFLLAEQVKGGSCLPGTKGSCCSTKSCC
ncbi:arsenite methyltransferase isoform X2 [Protopterus annectens]|uniref:arsenite methyltransferase isoform X2 n=1 Tax=Protopterus annectens TaxID=7888 RepID=UPI001CFBAE54|nr:arsenite methyltransferase isoform X2 [Protopterus annectens]